MTTTSTLSQEPQPEPANERQSAGHISPYRRGFEDSRYGRLSASPFAPGTVAAKEYDCGKNDARMSQLQGRTGLRIDETVTRDRLLAQRGLSAKIERISLQTGEIVLRFSIGAAGNPGGPSA